MSNNIVQQASDWLVAINDPHCTKQTQAEFEAWLLQNPEHQIAFEKVLNLWDALPNSEQLHAHKQQLKKQNNAKKPVLMGFDFWKWSPIAACLAVVMVFLISPFLTSQTEPEIVYRTQVGQVKSFTLSDGSVITLGGKSVLVSQFSADVRANRLDSGEAYFNVAANPERPFVVETGDTKVTVLGTEFEIKHQQSQVELNVAEGKVQITDQQGIYQGRPQSQFLIAGQGIVFNEHKGLGEIKPVNMNAIANWRDNRFDFEDQPLARIVERLNLYYPPGIVLLSNPQTENITASFNLSQIEAFLSGLAATYSLTVEQNGNGEYTITNKKS